MKLNFSTKMMLGGIAALTLSTIAVNTVFAYQGNPAIKGPNYTPERHEAMEVAFEKNDYQAWVKLMDGRGVTRKVTADNFARFAEAHRLAEDGKLAEAAKIRAELGLGQGNREGKGRGNGGCMNR